MNGSNFIGGGDIPGFHLFRDIIPYNVVQLRNVYKAYVCAAVTQTATEIEEDHAHGMRELASMKKARTSGSGGKFSAEKIDAAAIVPLVDFCKYLI